MSKPAAQENKDSKAPKTGIPGITPNITFAEFLELPTVEHKSQTVRAMFEKAAKAAKNADEVAEDAGKDSNAMFILCMGDKFYFVASKDKLDILCAYQPTVFEKEKIFDPSIDDMSGIEVSPETIFLYATSEATRSIPGLAKELAKSTWRSDKGILDYDKNGMPMLVLRDIIGPQQSKDLGCQVYMTSSDLNCDAHTIVTQQLINYGKTSANPLEIEFPKDEGRGAVFQIAGVPFHQYNSYSYNDSVCEKLGLFKVDKDQMFLRIRVDTIPGFILVKDPMDKKYSRIPAIEKRQRATKGFGYNQVLMIPLDHYADTCLEVQQQTDKALRIEKQDGSVATDAEIEAARKFLRLRMQHDKKTVPSLATVAASSAPSPKLKAREVAPAASKQAEAERID